MSDVGSAVAAIRAGIAELAAAPIDTLTHPELIALLNDITTLSWSLPAVEHPILARLMTETEPQTLGAKSWEEILTIALRLSKTEATRTIRNTQMLGPRRSLDGQPLPPHWNHVAAAQAQGRIGPAHLDTIAEFFRTLPHWIDAGTRADAETQLARSACGLDPDQLRQAAQRLALTLDPDGPVPDEKEQHRKRGLTIGRQQADGMSRISGYLTPEARACWDALAAKLAAPGTTGPDQNPSNSDPADTAAGKAPAEPPGTDAGTGTAQNLPGASPSAEHTDPDADDDTAQHPSGAQTRRDTRSTAQRNHDAFLAMTRMLLSSDRLGTHNGLPVTVIVSMNRPGSGGDRDRTRRMWLWLRRGSSTQRPGSGRYGCITTVWPIVMIRSWRLAAMSESCWGSIRRRCVTGSRNATSAAARRSVTTEAISRPRWWRCARRSPSYAGPMRSSRQRQRFSPRRRSTADCGDRRLHRRSPGPLRGRPDLRRAG